MYLYVQSIIDTTYRNYRTLHPEERNPLDYVCTEYGIQYMDVEVTRNCLWKILKFEVFVPFFFFFFFGTALASCSS